MPCYFPINGWLARRANASGKRSVVFNRVDGFVDKPMQVPCEKCIGCRLERSRQWAIRCVHESSLHDSNCFITLTFAPCHLDKDLSLRTEDFQLFMKRFRKRFLCQKKIFLRKPKICCNGLWKRVSKLRFFHCGEYGEKYERPHHHACIFGFDFPDKVLSYVDKQGFSHYWSEHLARLWPFGTHDIGDVSFESAAYVARYVCKKITGEQAEGWYGGRKPEFVTMSRRPGIASDWLKKFKDSVFPHDYVVIRGGIKCKPPKFYSRSYELTDPVQSGIIKSVRKKRAKDSPDNTDERLQVREVIQAERFKQLKRSLQ